MKKKRKLYFKCYITIFNSLELRWATSEIKVTLEILEISYYLLFIEVEGGIDIYGSVESRARD